MSIIYDWLFVTKQNKYNFQCINWKYKNSKQFANFISQKTLLSVWSNLIPDNKTVWKPKMFRFHTFTVCILIQTVCKKCLALQLKRDDDIQDWVTEKLPIGDDADSTNWFQWRATLV